VRSKLKVRNKQLTATGYDSFDSTPWIVKLVEYTKKALAHDRIRVIGVCFGHQIIGRALGQRVGRGDGGWEVSVTPIQLAQKGKELFKTEKLVGRTHSSKASSRD
jgi:GMP synthase-like glutamine amidotransferase